MRTASASFVALLVLSLAISLASGCLQAPGVGRAADPGRAQGPAPWGSATSNEEMQKKVSLLTDIMDGKLSGQKLAQRVEADYPDLSPDQRTKALSSLAGLVEDLRQAGQEGRAVPAGPDRDMAFAQLYFGERRFIEAATLLSKILDQNPTYTGARALLARCFFFLQNRDRTIAELEYVLQHPDHQKNKEEMLDALFLLGAAVSETPGMTRETMVKGKNAWETYLKLAPDSPQKPQIEEGLKLIEQGLNGEGPLAQPLVPTRSENNSRAPANVMGGAASMGTGGGGGGGTSGPPEAPAPKRVASLKPDAPPRERALAEGLDAVDAKDLALAETKLTEVTAGGAWDVAQQEALVGLGRVRVQQGRVDEALRTFGEVIKRNPDFMPAWHYNGMAHMLSGAPAEAIKSWQKILEKDPAYAQRFSLDRRIEVAKRMSR